MLPASAACDEPRTSSMRVGLVGVMLVPLVGGGLWWLSQRDVSTSSSASVSEVTRRSPDAQPSMPARSVVDAEAGLKDEGAPTVSAATVEATSDAGGAPDGGGGQAGSRSTWDAGSPEPADAGARRPGAGASAVPLGATSLPRANIAPDGGVAKAPTTPAGPAPVKRSSAPADREAREGPSDAAAVSSPRARRARATRVAAWASAELRRRKDRSAHKALEKAVGIDPLYAPAWRDLGVARARLGDETGARAAYETYLRLAPQAPDAPDVRRMLGQ